MKYLSFLCLSTLLLLTACTADQLVPVDPAAQAESEATLETDAAAAEIEAEIAANIAAYGAKRVINVPAGTRNALADAIATANRNDVIRLGAGDHAQDGTLTISKPINIIGAPGARLLVSGVGPFPTVAPSVRAAIHVLNTEFVRIRNLEIIPVGGEGGTAVLVQNAPYTFISRVTAEDWQVGVVAEQSPKLYVERSTFTGSSQWQTDPNFSVFGVVVINGERATIHNNTIKNAVFGVWACDKRGRLSYNRFSGNFNGIELCKVPVGIPLPDGQVVGSEFAATSWLVYHNESNGNFGNGLEIIDGANRCLLVNNVATGNGALDYEFAGPTERYGFSAPTSANNRAFLKPDSRWKDCGVGNRVFRGTEISVADSPCF
jgi:nitrous oxidase accessory protein NosD